MSTATKRDPAKWSRAKARAKAKMGGRWSARAAQLATQYYKKSGGTYSGPKRSDNKLSKWSREKWRTKDGKKAARTDRKGRKVTARYLPDSAWRSMSKSQARATDQKKRKASRKGKQFVSNTKRAKAAGKRARR
jgi:hypothetical protein